MESFKDLIAEEIDELLQNDGGEDNKEKKKDEEARIT